MHVLKRVWGRLRHPISQNVVALYGVQIGNMLVPLVTLPYVSRVLEPSGFGVVVFGQGVSFVLAGLIGWGFDAWGTREAAELREHRGRLSGLVADVLGARGLLAIASVPVTIAIYLLQDDLHGSPDILALAWVAAVANGLTPTWFFVGLERLRLVAAVGLALRIAGAALTFVLVQDTDDAWIVLALYAGASVGVMIFQTGLLYRTVAYVRPRLRASAGAIRAASTLFAASASIAMFTSMNVVILGLFVSSAQVAYFGAAERVLRAATQTLGPIGAAVYPRIAYLVSTEANRRALQLLFISGTILLGAGVAISLLLAGLAPQIIRLIFGPDFGPSVEILRIMSVILPFTICTVTAGVWLMVMRRDSLIVRAVAFGGLVNIVLACILVPAHGADGMAISVLAAEISMAVLSVVLATRAQRRQRDEVVSPR